jgi:hypothetical protein
MTHPFDYLRLWDSWGDSEIEKIVSDDTMTILQDAVHLLNDVTNKERLTVTRENFISLVREMHNLCKDGSRSLGNAIIKAWEYEEVGDFSKAIEVCEDFLSSCTSKFYRDIARGYIREYSEKL